MATLMTTYWGLIADVGHPKTPDPLASANIGNGDPPSTLRYAYVMDGSLLSRCYSVKKDLWANLVLDTLEKYQSSWLALWHFPSIDFAKQELWLFYQPAVWFFSENL